MKSHAQALYCRSTVKCDLYGLFGPLSQLIQNLIGQNQFVQLLDSNVENMPNTRDFVGHFILSSVKIGYIASHIVYRNISIKNRRNCVYLDKTAVVMKSL